MVQDSSSQTALAQTPPRKRGRPRNLTVRTYTRINQKTTSKVLPDDIDTNFSKWFNGDISKVRLRSKTSCPNVYSSSPDKSAKRLQSNDKLEPENYRYLTQDLERSEIIPIRQIIHYTLSITESQPSIGELQSQNPCCSKNLQNKAPSDSDVQFATEEPRSRSKQFQMTLTPQRTIIDCRPMLKMHQLNKQLPQNQTNGLHAPMPDNQPSSSLIAPGEDCDTTDDEEVIEIDCDTGVEQSIKI